MLVWNSEQRKLSSLGFNCELLLLRTEVRLPYFFFSPALLFEHVFFAK